MATCTCCRMAPPCWFPDSGREWTKKTPLTFSARGVFDCYAHGRVAPTTRILTPCHSHDTPAFMVFRQAGRIWGAVRYEFPNLIRPMDAAPLLGVSLATLYRMGPPIHHVTRRMAYIDAKWLAEHGADVPSTVSFDHAPTVRETARMLSCSTRQVHRLMACGRLAYAKTNARLALIDPESLARLTGRTARSRRYAC